MANQITLLLLKNIHEEKLVIDKLQDIFELGRMYFGEVSGLKYLESVIRYLLTTTTIKPADFLEKIKNITPLGGELIMTTAEKLIEEGKKQGILLGKQEGIQLGEEKGRFEAIKKLLSKGFDPKQIAELLETDLSVVEKLEKELK